MALGLALLALALAAADRATERRRAVARQLMVGVPPRVLRQGQLLQTLLPTGVAAALAIALGAVLAWAFTAIIGQHSVITAGAWVALVALVALGGLLVSLSTLPLIRTRITADLLRRE